MSDEPLAKTRGELTAFWAGLIIGTFYGASQIIGILYYLAFEGPPR